jgi:hypothetical protein
MKRNVPNRCDFCGRFMTWERFFAKARCHRLDCQRRADRDQEKKL